MIFFLHNIILSLQSVKIIFFFFFSFVYWFFFFIFLYYHIGNLNSFIRDLMTTLWIFPLNYSSLTFKLQRVDCMINNATLHHQSSSSDWFNVQSLKFHSLSYKISSLEASFQSRKVNPCFYQEINFSHILRWKWNQVFIWMRVKCFFL